MWQRQKSFLSIKGIFSDSYITFLWHESEDMNKERFISKISADSNLYFQAMLDYVHSNFSIGYCVRISGNIAIFLTKMISA